MVDLWEEWRALVLYGGEVGRETPGGGLFCEVSQTWFTT